MAQKGDGGNSGAVTTEGGDRASGSLGTGRGGRTGTGAKKTATKKTPGESDDSGQKISGA